MISGQTGREAESLRIELAFRVIGRLLISPAFCTGLWAGYTEPMSSTELLQVFERQNVTRGALQAQLGVAEATGDHDLANMLRAAAIIFEQAERERNSAPRVTRMVPAW